MGNAILVNLTVQADVFRRSDSASLVIRLILFRSISVEALACFFRSVAAIREGNIARSFYSSAYTRCCQAISNLDNARQI